MLIIITGANRLPWPLVALALGAGGFYLLRYGWQVWAGNGGKRGARVVYWRGQRIEINQSSQSRWSSLPSWRAIAPAALYLLLGGVLALAAVSVMLRGIGVAL
jgi:hypothetical protein